MAGTQGHHPGSSGTPRAPAADKYELKKKTLRAPPLVQPPRKVSPSHGVKSLFSRKNTSTTNIINISSNGTSSSSPPKQPSARTSFRNRFSRNKPPPPQYPSPQNHPSEWVDPRGNRKNKKEIAKETKDFAKEAGTLTQSGMITNKGPKQEILTRPLRSAVANEYGVDSRIFQLHFTGRINRYPGQDELYPRWGSIEVQTLTYSHGPVEDSLMKSFKATMHNQGISVLSFEKAEMGGHSQNKYKNNKALFQLNSSMHPFHVHPPSEKPPPRERSEIMKLKEDSEIGKYQAAIRWMDMWEKTAITGDFILDDPGNDRSRNKRNGRGKIFLNSLGMLPEHYHRFETDLQRKNFIARVRKFVCEKHTYLEATLSTRDQTEATNSSNLGHCQVIIHLQWSGCDITPDGQISFDNIWASEVDLIHRGNKQGVGLPRRQEAYGE